VKIIGKLFLSLLEDLLAYEVLLLLSHSFGSIVFHFIYMVLCFVCFYLILNIMHSFVMFMYSSRYVCSFLGIVFYCVFLWIVCVKMCTVLLPQGDNLIAVNEYSLSYHIITYHIVSYHSYRVLSILLIPSHSVRDEAKHFIPIVL
jgi:hypothetical protein